MKDIFDDINSGSGNQFPGESHPTHDYSGDDNYLSMGEYEELRLLLSSAKAAFATEDQDIEPRLEIHKNLRQMVAAKRKGFEWPSLNISKIAYFPVPAYQVGLASVILMIMVVFMSRNNNLKSGVAGAVVHKTDTIYEKVYKKVPIMALSDSESKMMQGTLYGPSYTDSMDKYDDTDTNNSVSPGINNSIDKNDVPAAKDSQPLKEINDQEKGGNYMEDSSKGNMQWHGLL